MPLNLTLAALALTGPVSCPDVCQLPVLTPCLTEDSTNCYWLADRMGNREGRSFIDLDGEVFYFEVKGE